MSKKKATEEIVRLIYQLAGIPEGVLTTTSAYRDMVRLRLKRHDICDAIREWIDAGKYILEDETRHDPHFTGETIYIIENCPVSEHVLYVKVQIRQNVKTGNYLLIISAHEPKY
ncbi:MAG: hypothetical protein OEV87_11320 [Phycisphaerae bacterium]|nr:hypothetical protein [Phycisphaerae bacterium]